MNIKSKKEINKIQMTGIVEDIKGEMYIIKVQNAFFEAKKAVSCLVKPQINDKVLFFKDETSYILAVLEHTGEVEINEEKLKIKSSSLKIESADFQNSSLNHQVVCGNFSVISENAEIKSSALKIISNVFHAVNKFGFFISDTLKIRSKIKDLKTKINKTSSKTDIKESENIYINAENEVKIDGKIINMG